MSIESIYGRGPKQKLARVNQKCSEKGKEKYNRLDKITTHSCKTEGHSRGGLRHSQNKEGRFMTFMDLYDINSGIDDIEHYILHLVKTFIHVSIYSTIHI